MYFSVFLAQWFFFRRFFKYVSIKTYVKTVSPIVASPDPWGPWFSQLWFYITRGCFHISFSFPDLFVLRKKNFENFIIFFLISNYLPFKKILVPNFHNFESSEPKNALCQVWSKLVQWFWRRSQKCEKFTDRQTTDRRQTDGRQTKSDQKSSLELSAQVS